MKVMRNGQLRENTLGVLIAVLGLVLIFGGVGYVLYNYFTLSAQQNEEQSRGLLKVLDAKVQALNEGQETKFLVKGPCEAKQQQDSCNWFLTGWSKEDDNRPERCFFKSCICICNKKSDAAALTDKDVALRDACQDRQAGACTFIPEGISRVKVSSMQNQLPDVPMAIEGVPVRPAEKSFIPFAPNLIELKMRRDARGLEITLA